MSDLASEGGNGVGSYQGKRSTENERDITLFYKSVYLVKGKRQDGRLQFVAERNDETLRKTEA